MLDNHAKVQKILASAGIASRRTIEEWITQKRIIINGKYAHIGQRVDPLIDKIYVDNKLIKIGAPESVSSTEILLYNKPVGIVCSRSDENNRENVFSFLPPVKSGRWICVGRLDINSSGLLLLTNNGELAYRLMHPKYNISRGYLVRVLGDLPDTKLYQLKHGIELEDGIAAFKDIHRMDKKGANQWFYVSLQEGRKREVRRLFESVDCKVNRLIRVNYGDVQLPKDLRSNRSMLLRRSKVNSILQSVGL